MGRKLNLDSIFPKGEAQGGLHVRVPKKLIEILESEAKEHDQNLSEFIRDLLATPFIPKILMEKIEDGRALGTEDHVLLKECKKYLDDFSASLRETTGKKYLVERTGRKIRHVLGQNELARRVIDEIVNEIKDDLFKGKV